MTAKPRDGNPTRKTLARRLRPFFWDHEFQKLSLDTDADLIIGRLLAEGDWESIKWSAVKSTLRREVQRLATKV